MPTLRIIHAADLHLDTAFAAQENGELTAILREATFHALKNLTDLCEREKPDALILAGDIYNDEETSLRAQTEFLRACQRLQTLGIPVYQAHGNHDPLNALFSSLRWPENVHVFGASWESFPLTASDGSQAILHGISHTSRCESRNLAAMLKASPESCPQIAVLHTGLGTETDGSIYAPCSLADLKAQPIDYWALGHIHLPSLLCEKPRIRYSGSLQGLHINEEGEHGCVLATLHTGADGRVTHTEEKFYPLAPVQWHILKLNLEDFPEPTSYVLLTLREEIRKHLEQVPAWAHCTDIVFRLELTGRSAYYAALAGHEEELCASLQDNEHSPHFWIKDIKNNVLQSFDMEKGRRLENLLGSVLRRCEDLRADPARLNSELQAGLEPLAQKAAACMTHLAQEDCLLPEKQALDILSAAEQICLHALTKNNGEN